MRLRTLPVSLSGVLMAIGIAVWQNHFKWIPAILCIIFALLAQVVSNFANEYYDYRHGADKKGRVGPRRGVTEGDIAPKTLRNATYITLAIACLVGCGLIPYGGWQMIPVGLAIAIFALAYSAGPYPLSYHGLGELTVFIFYGIVPVIFSYYVIAGRMDALAVLGGITIGFMAIAMLSPLWLMIYLNGSLSWWAYLVPLLYLVLHTFTWFKLNHHSGAALNPLLGETARNMLIFTILMLIAFIF